MLADDVERESIADDLRDVAYDVMLEHGPVVELHVMTESRFDELRERRNPFVRNVITEGRSYAC